MYLKAMDLGKAIKPVIDTKRGPSIAFKFAGTEACAEERACSISRDVTLDGQFDWSSFLVLDVELERY
jgi:hypothetical protein